MKNTFDDAQLPFLIAIPKHYTAFPVSWNSDGDYNSCSFCAKYRLESIDIRYLVNHADYHDSFDAVFDALELGLPRPPLNLPRPERTIVFTCPFGNPLRLKNNFDCFSFAVEEVIPPNTHFSFLCGRIRKGSLVVYFRFTAFRRLKTLTDMWKTLLLSFELKRDYTRIPSKTDNSLWESHVATYSQPVPKRLLHFLKAEKPINELVTKFGGQPVWLRGPSWPISRKSRLPIPFVCQIAMKDLMPSLQSTKMVYLFADLMADSGFDDPESGEHAIIVQPGRYKRRSLPLKEGPTLELDNTCEYSVVVSNGIDELKDLTQDEYECAIDENKIGGIPLISTNSLSEGRSHAFPTLLLQINLLTTPFLANPERGTLGCIFLNQRGDCGRFVVDNPILPVF